MKRAGFTNPWLPVLLLIPQLAIICLFFYWPAWQALKSSFYLQDPFGFGSTFVGWDNYTRLFRSGDAAMDEGSGSLGGCGLAAAVFSGAASPSPRCANANIPSCSRKAWLGIYRHWLMKAD